MPKRPSNPRDTLLRDRRPRWARELDGPLVGITPSVSTEGWLPAPYVANELLVPQVDGIDDELAVVRELCAREGWVLTTVDTVDVAPRDAAIELPSPVEDASVATSFARLRIEPGDSLREPDAFGLLRALHRKVKRPRIGLNHLLSMAPFNATPFNATPFNATPFNATPFNATPFNATPFNATAAIGSYAMPGTGGKQPVSVVMDPPAREQVSGRRITVAVLDTGCADHEWFEPDVVQVPQVGGRTIGLVGGIDAERQPDDGELIDGLAEPVAGHGTFIAGIVRQVAPHATVLAVRVCEGDGIIDEFALAQALADLIAYQASEGPVDVLSLSLTYVHERGGETVDLGALSTALLALRSQGTTVVASAGNAASSRPHYPAAFSQQVVSGVAPLVSVGALNPNGTIAAFSNEGGWVTHWRSGAALVSTHPKVDTAMQPMVSFGQRETIDLDDYSEGFAVWSGTSFAGPLLAAGLAAILEPEASAAERIGRAQKAVATL